MIHWGRQGRRFSIRVTVLGVVTLVAMLTAGVVLGLQYYFSSQWARQAAEGLCRTIGEKVSQRVHALDSESMNMVEMLSHLHELKKFPDAAQVSHLLPLLGGVIGQADHFYAMYAGYDNGDYFELVNLESTYTRSAFQALPEDRWVQVTVRNKGAVREKISTYLDTAFRVRTEKQERTTYDPRNRPWFANALERQGIIQTPPYVFANLGVPGVTYAKSMDSGSRVVAVDISLKGLSGYLQKQQLLPHSQAFLFDDAGQVIARAISASADLKSDRGEKQSSPSAPSSDVSAVTDQPVPHSQLLELASASTAENTLHKVTIKGQNYFAYVSPIMSKKHVQEYLGMLVSVEESMRPYLAKVRLSLFTALALLVLLVPVVWYCATIIVTPIKALALENDKVRLRRYDDVNMVESNIAEIIELSNSMVSMAKSIQEYDESLKALMDAFIRVIAVAIDHKSSYTGGHCARVPELATMIAEAAHSSPKESFTDFHFSTDEEWREFRTAAWLHDCGKVATPEYIVDKATKLETLYNRIHEIRMRFEVLLRDAEIEYWQELAEGGEQAGLAEKLAKQKREIEEDFAFIAECNIGGEFMGEDKVERVQRIAARTWTRHLDDRLGLGHLELMRYPEHPVDLPCKEFLLADRREHIIKRQAKRPLGDTDSRFKMDVPEHLYNLGEVYNLCISRGTLTAEDRYIINEHIITTIQMLETLPYPENMTRIPEYAGAHHETLIGTGYPRKLTAKEIGLPARIMALADVFEALTASDRPYKKAKKLSEAIYILNRMVKKQHLDKDLFRLFLESGVYLEYARKFCSASQIDDIDIAGYLEDL
ncbi:HD domain-containing phosphohydrolase [Desulfogranum japonicum]|uniref:HD domain-containing phosphohydrolase n=1 Tax=Desulfogranum japonicum TaxID=231447 RepID=UPI0004109004|nr:HD domain-containing phosphohydrolase [Desulfogranum japonicum]